MCYTFCEQQNRSTCLTGAFLSCQKITMRKVELLTILFTLALAIPFTILALIEAVYLIDYARNVGNAMNGLIEWRQVALEGSARWPELAGMIIGQLFILSMLLIARRQKPDNRPDLFGNDLAASTSKRPDSDRSNSS